MTAIPSTVVQAFQWQYSTDRGANWHLFGRPADLGALVRSRRFGLAAGQSVTARDWRLVKVNPAPGNDWGANFIQLNQIAFWVEDMLSLAEIPAVRLVSFNFDDADQRYILVSTDGNIDVWHDSDFMVPVISPYDADQAPVVSSTQMLDTLIAFHQEVAPLRIMRQGAHTEWDSRALAFDNLPLYDYDGTHIGGVDEVQQLTFLSYVNGDTFNITLEEETTAPIAFSTTDATTASRIQAALAALPSVGAGQVAVSVVGTATYNVTFQGTDADADIGTMAPVTLVSAAGGVSVANIVQGLEGGEAIISAARGWPATGCFYQQRLYMAGPQGRPETVMGSQLGAYFSFDTKGANTAGAISENMDTDQVTAIRAIFAGRNLQVFTNSAEFWFPIEPISPPAPVKQATKRGVQVGTPQHMMDLATLFVGQEGDALYSYDFDFLSDNYKAANLAVEASHLVNGVIDLGFRKHKSTAESDLAIMPRSDGTAVVMVALADQDVTGFVPWQTAGSYLAAAAEEGGDVYVATARMIGGAIVRFLERLDEGRLLDCSTLAQAGDPRIVGKTMSGFGFLEGATVTLYIDGADAGDVEVIGGMVALPRVPARTIEVGMNFQVTGRTLPMVFQQDPRGGASSAPEVGDIEFRLGPTANLKAGLVGGKKWRVPLKTWGQALLDQGPGESAFTGWTRLQMVPGFRPDAQIEWVQDRPGPLQIQEIVVRATS